MNEKKKQRHFVAAFIAVMMVASVLAIVPQAIAQPVYINDSTSFPAYAYNTEAYKQGETFVGCGPTTGAMILTYFENTFSLVGLLDNPVAGVNKGLDTAWTLHSSQYMNTNDAGFGSPYDIEPGMEDYAEDKGHNVTVMVHVSPTYDPTTAPQWLKDYGPYGDAWMNDGYFWTDLGGDNWSINPDLFCDFVDDKLSAKIAIWLAIDTDFDGGGDHWVPLVGYNRDTYQYAFYDTTSLEIQWADIHYCGAPEPRRANAISFVRSVEYLPGVNEAPVADANGPYETAPCTPVTLDGSGSYDPDSAPDHIVSWEWDLDNDGEYDDATGEFVAFHSDVEGVYVVHLRVTDTYGATGTDSTTVEVKEAKSELCPDKYRWGSWEWDPSPGVDPDYPGGIFVGRQEVHFVNKGTVDVFDVTARVTCVPINVEVPDPDVTLGDIPAGGSAWSTDTFELRVDMSNPQGPDKGICWEVEYADADGVRHTIEDVAKFCGEECSDICP